MEFEFKKVSRFTMRSKNIDRLLAEISKYKKLTPIEERDLFIKMEDGDSSARTKLINHNLRFVVTVAKHFSGANVRKLEANIAEGTAALIEAVDSFDNTRGFKFISYAVKCISGQILTRYNKGGLVRTPITKITQSDRKQINKLFESGVSEEDIAEITGVKLYKVKRHISGGITVGSLDAEDIDGITLLDRVPTYDKDINFDIKNTRIYLAGLLSKIPPNQAKAVELYYLSSSDWEINTTTVARKMGLSRQMVDHHLKLGLKNLKKLVNK